MNCTSIDKHENEDIGGWDIVLTRKEYNELYAKQQSSMTDFVNLMVTQPIEKIKNVKPQKVAVKVAVPKTNGQGGMSSNEISEWEEILSEVHEGTIVSHKTFGAGTVVSLKNGMRKMNVQFSSGTKLFIFPDAFIKGFLKVED